MQNLIDIVDGVLFNSRLQVAEAKRLNGAWHPACGGKFISRGGHRLLYCWQPSSGRHAYINLDTDIVLTDDEARALLGTY
jgi:transposase